MSDDSGNGINRRQVLGGLGALGGAALAGAAGWYYNDNNYTDADEDGIPDDLEDSQGFHNYMEDIYGEQFEGLDPDRKDLLIDARYIGDASVSEETKSYIEELFRENDIYAQWLDHPEIYNEKRFSENHGEEVGNILGPVDSFYTREIEDELKDIAIQLVVLPDEESGERTIRNEWEEITSGDGEMGGTSLGNRAVVVEQPSIIEEKRLNLHEIGHTWLCHDYENPDNLGVMGPETDYSEDSEAILDYMPHEWERIHNNMDNIRDTTGIDIAGRRCLLKEEAEEIYNSTKEN